MIAARVLTIDVETIRQSAAGPIGWVVSWSGVTDKGFYYTVAGGYRLRKDAHCAFLSSAALMATDEGDFDFQRAGYPLFNGSGSGLYRLFNGSGSGICCLHQLRKEVYCAFLSSAFLVATHKGDFDFH